MNEPNLPTLLQLRLLVGYLGERAQFSWWSTAFFEPSSKQFLEPVFTKTSRLAQYHGVVEAARRLHDEHLNVRSYHLFRLPEEVEQDLHALVQSAEVEVFSSQSLQSKGAAFDVLARLAGATTKANIGPSSIGSIKDLDSKQTSHAIATAYLAAFNENVRTYPYLVG